jgi:hypothetical protein
METLMDEDVGEELELEPELPQPERQTTTNIEIATLVVKLERIEQPLCISISKNLEINSGQVYTF